MTGARRATQGVVTRGHTSRLSASFVIAVAAHAAIFALLAGSAIVRLDIVPTTIELAFLDASDRTAGPGETAPELRLAAPAEPPAPAPPTPPEPPREETPPEPIPAPAEPAVRLEPEPVAKPKPQSRPQARPKPAAETPSPPAPASAAGQGTGSATESASADGTDVRSTAPAWAPSARVRYEQLLYAWMDRHKQYPMLAQRRGIEGEGSVRVRIDRDGRVLERTVTRSTGQQMLDQAALDMVRRANPFPRVPPEYAGETFEFVAPIQYRLR
jgi:protein TonB